MIFVLTSPSSPYSFVFLHFSGAGRDSKPPAKSPDVDADGVPIEGAGGADLMVRAAAAKQRLLDACDGNRDLAIAAWGDRGSASIRTSELQLLIDAATGSLLEAEVIDSPDPEDVAMEDVPEV